MAVNENLVVWTTDWHVVSDDSETTTTGTPTTPTKAQEVVAYLNSLEPFGCIDTGDNKDHYGFVGTADEHDNYVSYVGNELAWLPVNAGVGINALYPNLPGNHDEVYDSPDTGTGNNDFSATYDVKFWGPPYHWTADWDAPMIRFIGVHTYIHHHGTEIYPDASGTAHIEQSELDWLENEINTLPERWLAIVCSHFPIENSFGNNVRYTDNTYILSPVWNDLLPLLTTYRSKIICSLAGHRHINWGVVTTNGVTYIVSGGVSYGFGNGYGGFSQITYDPAVRSLTFDYQYARASTGFPRFTGFTPYVIQLQPHRLFIARAA